MSEQNKSRVCFLLLLVVAGFWANYLADKHGGLDFLAASSSDTKRFTIHVKLKDEMGRMFTFKEGVTKRTFNRLEAFGRRKAMDYIKKAKCALAAKCGYCERSFTKDNSHYVRCTLEKISVHDSQRDKWYTVYRPDRRTS